MTTFKNTHTNCLYKGAPEVTRSAQTFKRVHPEPVVWKTPLDQLLCTVLRNFVGWTLALHGETTR